MTIEERFERLEKQNRKLKKWMAGIGALALAAFIGGTALSVRAWTASIQPDVVVTKLVDARDNYNRSRVLVDGGNGVFKLNDVNGKMRAQFDQTGNLALADQNGKLRMILGSDGSIQAFDSNVLARVIVRSSDGKIVFRNASGQTVLTLPQ